MEVYAAKPAKMGLRELADFARRAERMGYDGITVSEGSHDGFLNSLTVFHHTERLHVATSIIVAFPRSPMIVAIAAWDLAQVSGGRFQLGLGTQVKGNIERRFSTEWSAPAPRMRDYLASLRAIWESWQSGDGLDFHSDHYDFTLMQPHFDPGPIDYPDIPLYVGAIGPAMTRLAGRLCDGMITHGTNTEPDYLRNVTIPNVRKGTEQGGRDFEQFTLHVGASTVTGPTPDAVEVARLEQLKLFNYLYSTPAYWPALENRGWGDVGRELRQLTREGRWDELTLFTAEMMAELVPIGTYAEIGDILMERFGGLAQRITLAIPEDPAHDDAVARAIRQLQAE